MDTLSELSARLPQLELRSAACSQAALRALAAAEHAAEELATVRAELACARAAELTLRDSPRAAAAAPQQQHQQHQQQRALAPWEVEYELEALEEEPSAAAPPLGLLRLPAPPSPEGLLRLPAPPSPPPHAAPASAAPPLPRPIPWARAAAQPALLRAPPAAPAAPAAPAPAGEAAAAAAAGADGGGGWGRGSAGGSAASRAPPLPLLQPAAPPAPPQPQPRSALLAQGLCAAFQQGACGWGSECRFVHKRLTGGAAGRGAPAAEAAPRAGGEGEGGAKAASAKARKGAPAAPAPAAAPPPPPPPKRCAAQAAALAAQRAGAAAAAAAALAAVPPASRAFAARLTARAPKDARTCIALLCGAALAGEGEALVAWVQEARGWRSLGVLLGLCVEEGLALRVVVKVDRVSGGSADLGVFHVTLPEGGGGGSAGAAGAPLRLAPSAVSTRGASAHASRYCFDSYMGDSMRRLQDMLGAAAFPFAVFGK